jgi:outer membrane autotransporter protein
MGQTVSTTTLWYGEMNEIRKRMGELRMGSQSADDLWARAYSSRFTVSPAGAKGFRQRMSGLEIGKDNPQSFSGGKKYTGFLLGYGKADNTFDGGSGGTTESGYLGAYASWVRDNGAYFDLIGKYNRFSPRFWTANDRGSYDGSGLGLSAEIGKRFERGDGFFVEPAAELSAMWMNRAAYTTANGLAVEVPAATSLQLRLGLTGGRKWQGADGAGRQLYGKVAWVNEYKGDSTTRVDEATFESSVKGHQWVAGFGFVYDSGKHQLYIDAEKSRGTTVSKDWGVNAGCRWKF